MQRSGNEGERGGGKLGQTPEAMNANELLAKVRVASPCHARWEDMSGDERSRHCRQCDKRIYNFSAMSANEAAELIRATEGKLCGRFYRRADGTMLSADCPVGLERQRRRLKVLCSTAATLLLSSLGVTAWSSVALQESDRPKGRFTQICDDAMWKVKGWFVLNPPVVVMGVVCVPTKGNGASPVVTLGDATSASGNAVNEVKP